MKTAIFEYVSGDIAACISEVEDQKYMLEWNDHIVNSWEETYSTLSIAMMRLALLLACEERAWESGFINDVAGHEISAKAYIDQSL